MRRFWETDWEMDNSPKYQARRWVLFIVLIGLYLVAENVSL